MRKTTSLGFVLALAGASLAGCESGADSLSVDGLYYVESSISTPQGLPEQEAYELHEFSKLSGHPERVGAWVLEMMEEELDGTAQDILKFAREGNDADREFQVFLEEEAPELVTALSGIADDVVSLTTSFNFYSELELRTDDEDRFQGEYIHTVTGVVYNLGGVEYRQDFSEMGLENPPAMRGRFLLYDDKARWGTNDVISFDANTLSLEYGAMLDYAFQEIVVERTDPYSDSFTELVTNYIPCRDAGKWLEDELDGPSEIYGAACAGAFSKLGDKLLPTSMSEMETVLAIEGDALMTDERDGDRRVDAFAEGEWEGSFSYPTQTIQLRRGNHLFTADRRRGIRNNTDDVGR